MQELFFLQLPDEAICGDKALKARAPSEGAPHTRAGFVQSLLAALGSGLLQAPLFRFFGFFHGFFPWRTRGSFDFQKMPQK